MTTGMGNITSNTSALIRAQVYSDMILDTIKDDFLPEGIHRDVTDFPDGSTLNIPTFGDLVIRDLIEDQETPVDPLDTGNITLQITEHVGNGVYLTDELRENSWLAAQFDAAIVPKQLRAIKEKWETDLLKALPDGQTPTNPMTVNGAAHRYVASGTNEVLTLEDIAYAKFALERGNANDARIAIVDPLQEMTVNALANLVNASYNPEFRGIVETGFGKNMRFLRNIYGFDFYVSNRLPRVASETIDTSSITTPAPSGNDSITNGIAVQFMAVGDPMESPVMGAWRRMPYFEGERQPGKRRDVFYSSARWGFGLQRTQTGVVILASAANYK